MWFVILTFMYIPVILLKNAILTTTRYREKREIPVPMRSPEDPVRRAILISTFSLLLLLLTSPAAQAPVATGTPTVQPETHPAYVPGELIVGLKPNSSRDGLDLLQGMNLMEGNAELDSLHTVVVEVTPGQEEVALQELLSDPAVLFAEYNYYIHAALVPDDPLYSDTDHYGPRRIQAESAWDITTGSSSVIVAVLDSGIDAMHTEFSGRLMTGYDFVDDDWEPDDEHGHGTHVTGIIAATGNNATGMAGMDWHARILPLRVLDETGWGTVDDLAAALIYAADQGADVINMSVGGSFQSSTLQQASYYAYRKGAAQFASSGNGGAGTVLTPANYPWVMAVGATTRIDQRAALSNYGPELDIMAPGVNILSAYLSGGYQSLSGTSFSCPFAAGTAALLASQALFDTPDEIYYALRNTALDIGDAGFDNRTGYGLLQAADALNEDLSHYMDPDAVEYDMLSSTQCVGETFGWVDATVGSLVYSPSNGNNASEEVGLPFTFDFGGLSYVSMRISSNGYLTFGSTGNAYINAPMPQVAAPNQVMAPFWDDNNPLAAEDPLGGVYTYTQGSTPNRQFVIEWYRVPLQEDTSTVLTFEVILYETSNEIRFQYLTLQGEGSDGSSATVGIEYQDGESAMQYSYNRAGALSEGQSIRFIPQVPGTTRSYASCLAAQPVNQVGGTLSLYPWSVVVPAGLVPAGGSPTVSLTSFTDFSSWTKYIDLQHYVDVRLNPTPPTPFSPPLEIRYAYSAMDALKAGGHLENLFLARYDPQTHIWEQLPTILDEPHNQIVAYVTYPAIFGVYTLEPPEELPVTGAYSSRAWLQMLASWTLLAAVIKMFLCRRS